ncbi:MAG: hypothetical protein D6795_01670 [Deltaproteobacteria bacterium]|nr:MAG: hypothetical protein D6795_01670 [Deltaproteobacteria bacterium]
MYLLHRILKRLFAPVIEGEIDRIVERRTAERLEIFDATVRLLERRTAELTEENHRLRRQLEELRGTGAFASSAGNLASNGLEGTLEACFERVQQRLDQMEMEIMTRLQLIRNRIDGIESGIGARLEKISMQLEQVQAEMRRTQEKLHDELDAIFDWMDELPEDSEEEEGEVSFKRPKTLH